MTSEVLVRLSTQQISVIVYNPAAGRARFPKVSGAR